MQYKRRAAEQQRTGFLVGQLHHRRSAVCSCTGLILPPASPHALLNPCSETSQLQQRSHPTTHKTNTENSRQQRHTHTHTHTHTHFRSSGFLDDCGCAMYRTQQAIQDDWGKARNYIWWQLLQAEIVCCSVGLGSGLIATVAATAAQDALSCSPHTAGHWDGEKGRKRRREKRDRQTTRSKSDTHTHRQTNRMTFCLPSSSPEHLVLYQDILQSRLFRVPVLLLTPAPLFAYIICVLYAQISVRNCYPCARVER